MYKIEQDTKELIFKIENKWKNLADFIVDLKKKNIDVSPRIITALTCCRSLINHCKYHLNNKNNSFEFQKIVAQLSRDILDIESSLIIIAADKLGEQYALEWSVKLGEKIPDIQDKVGVSSLG